MDVLEAMDGVQRGLDELGTLGLTKDWHRFAACASHPELSSVWLGSPHTNRYAVHQARGICHDCPALQMCRERARRNPYEPTFLAGQTVDERRTRLTNPDRIAWRRAAVLRLHGLGLEVADMVDALVSWIDEPGSRGVSRRTVEQDLVTLGLSGLRRQRKVAA